MNPGWPFSRDSGSLEACVHEVQDRGAGSEVGRDREHACGILRAECLARPEIGAHFGAAEAIDGLLGVADQEERARTDLETSPLGRCRISWGLAAQAPEDLRLQRIGVLELVDEDVGETRGERPAHRLVIAQQVARGEEQVVEVEQRGGALVVPEALRDRLHELHELAQHPRGRALAELRPCHAALLVVRTGQSVQPIGTGFGEAYLPCCRGPLPFLTVRQEAARLSAEIGMEMHAQQRDPIGGVFAREVENGAFGQLGKVLRDDGGLRLRGARAAHEGAEFLCRTAECVGERRKVLWHNVAGGLAVAAQTAENPVNQRYGLVGVLQHHLLEQPAALSPERLSQPRFDDLLEDEVGLVTVHHHGARIDAGLYRIGFDEALAEAVNRQAGQLVDVRMGSGETALLSV